MLRALSRRAASRLALVSSDNEVNARRQLGDAAAPVLAFRLRRLAVRQGRKVPPRRAAAPASRPAQAIAIGDEVRDIEAARAAGIACAAVTWGYAAPEALRALGLELVFDRMEDIAGLLANKGLG